MDCAARASGDGAVDKVRAGRRWSVKKSQSGIAASLCPRTPKHQVPV